MEEFFEKTWFIWWVFAFLSILRWSHTISANSRTEISWRKTQPLAAPSLGRPDDRSSEKYGTKRPDEIMNPVVDEKTGCAQ